ELLGLQPGRLAEQRGVHRGRRLPTGCTYLRPVRAPLLPPRDRIPGPVIHRCRLDGRPHVQQSPPATRPRRVPGARRPGRLGPGGTPMTGRLLQTVLRHAEVLAAETAADAELVRRFARTRDEPAFAELLRRHGPMVWAVCRHLLSNDADAEDAFQATFLALI